MPCRHTNAAPGAAFSFWARSLGLLLLFLLPLPATAAKQITADSERAARAIVTATNTLRKREGRARLDTQTQLTIAARGFARFLATSDLYSHTADGRQPHERAQQHGYEYCIVLENIAYQFRSQGFDTGELAQTFVAGWERSPGHRKNMLHPDVTQTGVGVARNERTGYYYAVQLFGRPKSDMTSFSVANETKMEVAYTLGGRSFALAPGVTRTHKQCGTDKLEFRWQDDGRPTVVVPAHGERYAIERAGSGSPRVRKQ